MYNNLYYTNHLFTEHIYILTVPLKPHYLQSRGHYSSNTFLKIYINILDFFKFFLPLSRMKLESGHKKHTLVAFDFFRLDLFSFSCLSSGLVFFFEGDFLAIDLYYCRFRLFTRKKREITYFQLWRLGKYCRLRHHAKMLLREERNNDYISIYLLTWVRPILRRCF